jgi:RNA polymerase sigma-70 factor, ECF subfamily
MEVNVIYKRFHQELLGFIKSKIRSREDAEDILQNVFIKISLNIDTLTDNTRLKNWIYSITRNSIIDYYRAKASKETIDMAEEVSEKIPEADNVDPTKGLDECLISMIELLPLDYRHIIIDSEITGIKQKDLAEKYGIAYPSLRSRVQRGRARLKELLTACCQIETDSRGNILHAHGKNQCGPCTTCETTDP